MALDLVIPAHNEEHRIDRTLSLYTAALRSPDLRIIVALDACSDGTADVVARHARRDPRVDLLQLPKMGKGGVLIEAFGRCRADLVGFVDADGATSPAELSRLVGALDGFDGAIASRRHPAAVLPVRRALSRRLTSAGFALWVRVLFGLPFADTQCGAKVMRRDVIDAVLPLLSSPDLLFDVDLLGVAHKLGFQIAEVPAIWVDQPGSRVRATADGGRMAASSIRLWRHHRDVGLDRSRPARAA